MKDKIKLRTLVSFSFVLFCLPFLRTCSDNSLDKLVPVPTESVATETAADGTSIKDTIKIESISKEASEKNLKEGSEERKISIEKAKKEFTYNFYSLIYKTLNPEDKKLSSTVFSDLGFYPILALLLVFISSITMLILSFRERIKQISLLAAANLVLLITAIILFYASQVIEDLNQIKIGFYLVVINTVLIIILAWKIKKTTS